MTTYRAPLDDILFAARLAAGASAFEAGGILADLGDGLLEATLNEAAKFAEERLASCYRDGDRIGAIFADGAVTTPPGWKEAYAEWVKGGWNALKADPAYGGLGLPRLLNAACTEIWQGANAAFAICPLLSQSAMEALERAASEELKKTYLAKMVRGEWGATMNLTEPQAGSDLALTRVKARPQADGSYRLFGQKIFITYGEHDLTENIVHLVLARLPDAPPGTQGISLFLAPKFIADSQGRFTRRNDLRCAGIEHKLGIRGSPTCTMAYGDGDGAVAYLVGEENKGLATMFAMMNDARLAVGLQGVGIAERATQQALAYARERLQGRTPESDAPAPILAHPDVKRMALTMTAQTHAARAICYETAASLDRARRQRDPARASEAQRRADLLTPVAKAFSTDIGHEVASLGVQIFGGIGYIEETGAAQVMRDARIAPIYEGTNGIQAIDLVTRKLQRTGSALAREIEDMRAIAAEARFDGASALVDAVADFERTSRFMLKAAPALALAGATPYLRLFALARGGTLLAKGAAQGEARRIAIARFFARNLAVASSGLAREAMEGGAAVIEAEAALHA
ncbi:acyl-CoA dehydrogenase family protein [Methylocystis bryophila]|uniref:3-methylmercaptopropionyl-CoA dehydrogenase n=1 Tax=Methylocystis bryophila TaxID=655015 RepID=A0A1W6MRL0_9HYPH|nr:acyl-CoA dehydrogenase family protein [Methylocystis bryophila]ARN80176.1 acyl-CoA dehydrogenase [Methylocystis bryophila]BDV40119.1 acyl-CoA dehydrogenase [Methylocystis bryophila]